MTPTDGLRRWAAATLMASFDGADVPPWLARWADHGLGGVCLFGPNVTGGGAGAVAQALHAIRPSLVVALDEEGGDVTRLEAATGSSVPGNAALGAIDDLDLTASVGAALGGTLRSAGVDLDLAPCADVNSDRRNPVIGVRSFGEDAGLVARHTAAFLRGLQSQGVAACAKHFPGHGATDVDSHVALPVVDAPADVLRRRELVPFRAAIVAEVAAIMSSHVMVPVLDAVPATVSRRILTDVLRGELGFRGAVVTDALDMEGIGGLDAIPANVVRALVAGVDVCLLGSGATDDLVHACVAAVVAGVRCGELAEDRLIDAADRAAALGGRRVGAVGGPSTEGPGLAEIGAIAAARALRLDGRLPASLAGAHVVQLDSPATIAAGKATPWGIAAALHAHDASVTGEWLAAEAGDGDPSDAAGPAPAAPGVVANAAGPARRALRRAAGRPLVVVTRDAHRHPGQLARLKALVSARPDAVIIDMGWPVDGVLPVAAATVTTFGASRSSGEAVASLLLGASRPGRTSVG